MNHHQRDDTVGVVGLNDASIALVMGEQSQEGVAKRKDKENNASPGSDNNFCLREMFLNQAREPFISCSGGRAAMPFMPCRPSR